VTDTGRHSSQTTTPGDHQVAVEPQRTETTTSSVTPKTGTPEAGTPDTSTPATGTPDTSTQAAPPTHESLSKLIPIFAAIAVGVVWSISAGTFPVVGFVLAIVAMVMIHEFGHFVTAKWAGMKVTEFFFGFGPKLWSIRRGETVYGIKALPLGGYVKIIGMSNLERGIDPADEPRTYRQQSYPKRVIVAVAGVVTHFVVAFVLLMLMWTLLGVPRNDQPVIGTISRLDSGQAPAVDAGFMTGDRILAVDGTPITKWADMPPLIQKSADRPLRFLVERDGAQLNLTATPAVIDRDGATIGFIGIGSASITEKLGPVAAVGRSGSEMWRLTTASVQGLGTIFTPSSMKDYANHLTGSPTPGTEDLRPVSVVGVTRIAGQAAESGAFNVIYVLVLLNLFVAVLNLVPLLPFDGGHIAVATYERLRSRAGRRYYADVGKLMPLTAAVVVFMVLLGLTSIYLDIFKPVGNPFQ
jgi:membrane-associated protease RseP (regulator of RpoE activity)